jgi:hypothetical protein
MAKTNYVLIDYENVQPKDLALLNDGSFKVKVFVGPNQGKIPLGLAMALQVLGGNAEYVLLETGGRNALDFHIAYYIGTLSAKDPSAEFHIISNDSGFDALIKHLAGKGIDVCRSAGIASIPRAVPQPALDAQVQAAVKDLIRRAETRPGTMKTLRSTLHALFRKQLSEPELTALLEALCKEGMVKPDGMKVAYDLPAKVPTETSGREKGAAP